MMQSLPYSLGTPEEHTRVSLASGGHPLQLLGDTGQEVAEPEVLAVAAAG